jgi:hypothetical protein
MDRINKEMLATLLEAEDISKLSLAELERFIQEEGDLVQSLPDGLCQTDPRNGDRILYVSQRSGRPHDNRSEETADPLTKGNCPICKGKTTGIVDVAKLCERYTFINKNLFPVVYPFEDLQVEGDAACGVNGMHFLQWTSSLHDKDWHNMPLSDGAVVMNRLAALEKKLVETGKQVLITRDAIQVMRTVMPAIGRETAYNITCHNGPGAGLYFEFLPYTQENGGLEHLGLYACQADPYIVADHIRTV